MTKQVKYKPFVKRISKHATAFDCTYNGGPLTRSICINIEGDGMYATDGEWVPLKKARKIAADILKACDVGEVKFND